MPFLSAVAIQAREREHMLQRERKHLKQILKLENVERVKRIKEYKRLEARRAEAGHPQGCRRWSHSPDCSGPPGAGPQEDPRLGREDELHVPPEAGHISTGEFGDEGREGSRHGVGVGLRPCGPMCLLLAPLQQRKKTAVATKIQKDTLMKLVEKAKTCTGDKAVKTLQKAIQAELRLVVVWPLQY